MEYPTTLLQATTYYSDPDRALETFSAVRWPDGVCCPHCTTTEPYFLKSRRVWKCRQCRKQFSAKVGTVMEDSAIGLDKWLTALWMLINAKNSVSSHELARSLGITQKSAWFLAHRIRHAVTVGSFEKLDGEVEVDETFIGPEAKKMNRAARKRAEANKPLGVKDKTVAFTAFERGGEVRAHRIDDTSRRELHRSIRATVEPGSTLYTDGSKSYDRLDGYGRECVNHDDGEYVRGPVHTQNVDNFHALFKRCIKGTWVNVSPQHVDRYLAEQEFRYNTRKGKDGERARTLGGQTAGKRLTYRQLTAYRAGRGPRRGFDWRQR